MLIHNKIVLGVDMGGTKIKAGLVVDGGLQNTRKISANATESKTEILHRLFELIDYYTHDHFQGIGLGVPSVIDVQNGIIYNVQNIPSWNEVHLKSILEDRYKVPVFVNNDANVFVLGEKYFGKGKPFKNIAGITLGTGMGTGLIINGHLYSGENCGAGEFGMLEYKDGIIENYSSGQFFKIFHNTTGIEMFERAEDGDQAAIQIFAEYGFHLGNVVKIITYSVDPQIIIFSGSVAKAFKYFKDALQKQFSTFKFPKTVEKSIITTSDTKDIAVLGAAALCFEETL
ncbi:MAG: ROK family protein [Candidatus Marinimicrobia bacterium]|nr:ROK family protein [Candidatus Neomarinimicrobiota bacterium]